MSHEVVPVGDHWALGCQDDHGRGRGSVGGEDLGSIPMAAPQNVEVMRVNPIRNSSRLNLWTFNRRCAICYRPGIGGVCSLKWWGLLSIHVFTCI